MKIVKLPLMLALTGLIACLLQGCITLTPKNGEPNTGANLSAESPKGEVKGSAAARENLPTSHQRQLIAADFVNALKQINTLKPAQSTILFLQPLRQDPFVMAVVQSLKQVGYSIRWIDDRGNDDLFHYRQEQEKADAQGLRMRYDLAVGEVQLRRAYEIDSRGEMRPVTPLYIKGAKAAHVVLNDSAFLVSDGHVAPSSKPLSIADDASPLGTLIPKATSNTKGLSLPLLAMPTIQNVFELGESNYEKTLGKTRVVMEQVLTFPNDSLRLGNVNKSLIGKMVGRFDPVSDVFSVIGCSLGRTKLKGGNAALALGRASRVREALLFAGIPPKKILDEGCWAGDHGNDTLPRRGVVITLNRQS